MAIRGVLCAIVSMLICCVPAWPAVGGRSRLHKEFNLATIYRWQEVRLDFHPAPPLNSAGFEFFYKFPASSPGLLNPDVLDLYTQLVYDPAEGRIETRFQDVWVRFVEPLSGTKVRLGHFDLPFGLNPVIELRGRALQPLTTLDLGFKKDWGVAVQGEWRGLTYETAATWGIGEEIRRRRGRYLWTGRIGTPTYRDVQYGVSLLYGAVARSGDSRRLQTSRRLAVDLVYLYHEPFTTLRSELVLGEDEGAPVSGLLAELTQILPSRLHWGIEAQARVWKRGVSPEAAARSRSVIQVESAAGFWHSLQALMTLRLHWLHYFPYEDFGGDDRIFAQLYYYGR